MVEIRIENPTKIEKLNAALCSVNITDTSSCILYIYQDVFSSGTGVSDIRGRRKATYKKKMLRWSQHSGHLQQAENITPQNSKSPGVDMP